MKNLIITLMLITSASVFAHTTPQPVDVINFWDGSFAYNRLDVTEYPGNSNYYQVTLSGSQIGVGAQMTGVSQFWSVDDRVVVGLSKDKCQIDKISHTLTCDEPAVVYASVSWNENPALISTLKNQAIQNIKISGTSKGVTMSFEIVPNEYFQSKEPVPTFSFSNFDPGSPLPN